MNTQNIEMQTSNPGQANNIVGQLQCKISKKQRELVWFDVSCLIINKMIGSGIFVSPAIVVPLAGSKWAALLMWIFGPETRKRLFSNGESQTAHDINQATDGPVHDPMHVWSTWGKWLDWRRTRQGSTNPSPRSYI